MDEILAKLDQVITKLHSKSVVLGLGGSGGQLIEIVQVLAEAKAALRLTRSALRQADALLHKGYGKLVEPEEE